MEVRNKVLTLYFKSEYEKLCKKVARRAGSPENAEDVVQEAFYRAIKYWNSFDPEKKALGAWFNTILSNACKDKKREDMMLGMCLEFEDDMLDGVEMSQTDHDTVKKIKAYIRSKPEPLSEVLILYFEHGYKPREIVEILDVDNKFVRQSVWRFKGDVAELMGNG